MITTEISKLYHFYPCTVALVGATRGEQTNFMAAAWNTCISFDPPLFGVSIAPKRFTHDMITESGEFTCNFLAREHIDTINGCGKISGTEYDKVNKFQIKLEEAVEINSPVIKAAYAAYECKVRHQYAVGDHTFFVGEVVAIHTQDHILNEKGLLNPNLIDFAMYMGSNHYISVDKDSIVVMPAEIELKTL